MASSDDYFHETRPRPVVAPVAFGGYVALPFQSGDACLVAWWMDGRAAAYKSRYDGAKGAYVTWWEPLTTPSHSALWPTPAEPPHADD